MREKLLPLWLVPRNITTIAIYVFGVSQKNTEQVYGHVSAESDIFGSKVFEANNTI